MQFITSTLLIYIIDLIGKLVCYAVYYKYIIDFIGKLVCYAVYYKYIIDLIGKLVCYAVYYNIIDLIKLMFAVLLQVYYWFNW